MDTFNILHISDLQFGAAHSILAPSGGEFGSHHPSLGKRITEALRREEMPPPHVVVLSGDITQRGLAAEFDSAFGFTSAIHELIGHTFHEPPDWIIVPGNHDVNWDASSANSATPESQRTSAMLAEFRTFCADFQGYLDQTAAALYHPFNSSEGRPVPMLANCRKAPFEVVMAPLNSCEREGHLPEQHYGYISEIQLRSLESLLNLAKSPWTFLIAVIHHNPALSSPTSQQLRAKFSTVLKAEPSLDPKKIPNLSKTLAAAASNHLVEPERVLRRLAVLGVQLVLHGHQHYDGPIHVQYPVEDENPFGHGGLSMMAAGSLGIGPRGDQPSTPSFQFYRIQREHFGWKVASDRFQLTAIGSVSPSIEIRKDKAFAWHCYSSRPRKVLGGLCDFLTLGPAKFPGSQVGATHAYTLADSFAWGHCFTERADSTLSIGCTPERILVRRDYKGRQNPNIGEVMDNASGVLAGVANILSKQKVYADLDVWGLAKAEKRTGEFLAVLDLKKTNFLPYVAINMQIRQPAMKSLLSKIEKNLDSASSELAALNNFLCFAKDTLSTRLSLNILIEIQDGSENFILLKRRSKNVTHLEGVIHFSAVGGFKCVLDADYAEPAARILEVEEAGSDWLLSALREETLLETGISIPPKNFRIMCITLTTLEYSPILTAVATIKKNEANLLEKAVVPTTHFEGAMLVPGQSYLPKTFARDWWEGECFLKGLLPAGTSLISSNTKKAEAAWQQLKECWEANENKHRGLMDPVAAAAIYAVLRGFSSLRSPAVETFTTTG